jgi:hypothetical protein
MDASIDKEVGHLIVRNQNVPHVFSTINCQGLCVHSINAYHPQKTLAYIMFPNGVVATIS